MKCCVQRGMFAALGGPHRTVQPAADANFCIGAEGCVPSPLKAANGGEQSQHALLEEIFTVPPCQKQGTGTSAHQPPITANQLFLGSGVF